MKRCPKCNIVATDDTHAFCRADGVLLVDSDSFGESETIDLQLVAPAASTSEEDESLNGPVGSTGLMNSLIGKSSLGNLIEKYKRPTVVWVTASVIALTLAVSTYFFVSRKGNATINSVAVLPFLNVNADQQLDYLSDGMTETLIYNLSRLPKLNVR